jgi:ABC-type uncharacterized transport system substrate-binding protein
VVLSDPGGAYAETAALLRAELSPRVDLRIVARQDLPPAESRPQLIVTLGATALREVLERSLADPALARVPVLAALLPRASYEALVSRPRPGLSAIFLDQPVGRYLDLLQLAMPERRRVGVVLGPESASLAPALAKAAAARGLRLVTTQMAGDAAEIYPALMEVLADADVLLALPDNKVFNAGTLQNILITTYRQRIPMVAFAAGYVTAGATLALHVQPAQAGQQVVATVRGFLAGRGLPPPQLAADFSVAVNERVARSLGVAAGDPAALAEALRRLEGAR